LPVVPHICSISGGQVLIVLAGIILVLDQDGVTIPHRPPEHRLIDTGRIDIVGPQQRRNILGSIQPHLSARWWSSHRVIE
jgi:hypothetical protein